MAKTFVMPFDPDWFKDSRRFQYPVQNLMVFELSRKATFNHARAPGLKFVLVWEPLFSPQQNCFRVFLRVKSDLVPATEDQVAILTSGVPLHDPFISLEV